MLTNDPIAISVFLIKIALVASISKVRCYYYNLSPTYKALRAEFFRDSPYITGKKNPQS